MDETALSRLLDDLHAPAEAMARAVEALLAQRDQLPEGARPHVAALEEQATLLRAIIGQAEATLRVAATDVPVVSGSELVAAIVEGSRSAAVPMEVLSPLAEVHVRVDAVALAGCLNKVARRVLARARPRRILLRLDDEEKGAALDLAWQGESLEQAELDEWLATESCTGARGEEVRLGELLRQYGGSTVAGNEHPAGLSFIRFVFPPAPAGEALGGD